MNLKEIEQIKKQDRLRVIKEWGLFISVLITLVILDLIRYKAKN